MIVAQTEEEEIENKIEREIILPKKFRRLIPDSIKKEGGFVIETPTMELTVNFAD